jgi:hypothetical protein
VKVEEPTPDERREPKRQVAAKARQKMAQPGTTQEQRQDPKQEENGLEPL